MPSDPADSLKVTLLTRILLINLQGLPRSHAHSRWDDISYFLYEDGDRTRKYGIFQWDSGSVIELREIPEGLEHSLIFFALGYLILLEADMASMWPPGGAQAHCDPPRFNVAALRERAVGLMSIE